MTAKTTILTAAVPYANGDIHIGHLVEYVQADIFARHLRLDGETCYYVCADDAHGAPIQMRAEDEGVTPEALIAAMKARHQHDFSRFGISFDIYHSTHSDENRALVEQIFGKLDAAGAIILKDVDQLFDEADNRFLADRYVRGVCPNCRSENQPGDNCVACGASYDALDLIEPVSVRSGTRPVVRKSQHLFFDMPRYAPFLEGWRHNAGLQEPVNNKLNEWFALGLRQWDISRDAPYFGFEIPGFPGKSFYVWLDAPIGYLASFKRLCLDRGLDFDALLNSPDVDLVHIIGKDIAYFHTMFWPAMLHPSGMRLPSSVFCHGFLTVNGRKMSKSDGTLIPAALLADAIDPDFFRYFVFSMLDDGLEDINLDLAAFKDRVNADLVGKIVNIASRSARILHDLTGGKFSAKIHAPSRFEEYLGELAGVRDNIRQRRYAAGCRRLVALAESTNKWITESAPWTLAKGGEGERAAAAAICTQALVEFRALMIALAAVTPQLSNRSRAMFMDPTEGASWNYAGLDPRPHLSTMAIRPFESLLRRVEDEQMATLVQAVPAKS